MTDDIATALALIRKSAGARTLYIVKQPTTNCVELTLRIPCGQTKYVKLGRWPAACQPTTAELAEDIMQARQTLGGGKRPKRHGC